MKNIEEIHGKDCFSFLKCNLGPKSAILKQSWISLSFSSIFSIPLVFLRKIFGKLSPRLILNAGFVSAQKMNEKPENHEQDVLHNGQDAKDTSKSNEMGMKGQDIADVDTGRAFVESNFVVYVESGVLNSAVKDAHKDKKNRFDPLQPL